MYKGTEELRLLHYNLWRASKSWWETLGDHPLHSDEKDE